MSDGTAPPTDADFTKTLTAVLLAEYLGVSAARGLSLACAAGAPAAAGIVSFAAFWLFVTVIATNLAAMAVAFGMRRDRDHARSARTSLGMTAGQTAALVASYLPTDPVFHAVTFALTAAALAATLAFSRRKFLRPPS